MGHPAHARPAATARAGGYARRRPETSVLYQTIAEHWPAFRERAEETGGLPKFIVDEFEEFLRCGRLDRGCLHLVCRKCGHSELVALCCKKRGFCAACIGRTMADRAVHLERYVLPAVPVRHWICSLPWGLRSLLGYDRRLCSEVAAAFVTELGRSLRRRAKHALALDSVGQALTGAVASISRTDSALRLNVHFHVLSLDGVYVRESDDEPLVFYPLPTPSRAHVAEVARRTAARIETILQKHGRSLDPEMADDTPPELALEQPGLAACYAAAAQGLAVAGDRAGQPSLRLVASTDPEPPPAPHDDQPIATVRGVNLYAVQRVDGQDRRQLERLCKYITRPPVAHDRLERRDDGRLVLSFKKPWKDGSRALVLEPDDLMVRLVAAVPPPRTHLLRYFGVLSSHSSLRREVVPKPPPDPTQRRPPAAAGDQLELPTSGDDSNAPPKRRRWAWLIRHVFRADVDTCSQCGGPMRWLDAATTPEAAERLLAKLGLAPQPPPAHPRPPLGQLALPFR